MCIFLEDVPIILVDIKDKESLKKMMELTKILISYYDVNFMENQLLKCALLLAVIMLMSLPKR